MRALIAALTLVVATATSSAAADWATFRSDPTRSASTAAPPLFTAAALANLEVKAQFEMPPLEAGVDARTHGFWSSPVISGDGLFLGGGNGTFYRFDRHTLEVEWQYPPVGQPRLTSAFICNPSSYGIASSAAITTIAGRTAVVFAAPDRSIGSGLGSGRLFALDAETGAEIWKSPEIAVLNGTMRLQDATTDQEIAQAFSEKHQQIGYSAPLVVGDRVFVGTANHCDNPIQQGRIYSVHLDTGAIDENFYFEGGAPRGGGVWSSLASDGTALYATTGNIRSGVRPGETLTTNNALAMLRVNMAQGGVEWKLQPVPIELDDDPDWAAGVTLLDTSCGKLAASTMKDGWTYAVRADSMVSNSSADVAWQYPPTGFPFLPTDTWTTHGDSRFLRPGLGWGDVFITMASGLGISTDLLSDYRRLYAYNACAPAAQRVRWIADIPHTRVQQSYDLSAPISLGGTIVVVTGLSWLVAIADPSIVPASGYRCEHPNVASAQCVASGLRLVPDPAVVGELRVAGRVFGEVVPSDDLLYVATINGFVQAIGPRSGPQ